MRIEPTDLRRTADLLSRAEAVAHIGSWRTAIPTGETEWSDEAYRIFGWDREKFSGDLNSAVRDAVHPDDLDRWVVAAQSASRGEISPLGDYRIVRPDGEVRWIRGGGQEERDEHGRVIALQGYMQDVTERKEAEFAIHMRDQATQALLNGITESALLATADGEVIAINATAAKRLGRSIDELIGTVVYDSLPHAVAETRREYLEQAVETGSSVYFSDERSGRHIRNSIHPLFVNGEVVQVVVFGYDVTEFDESLEALSQSEHWLSESQRVARMGHYIFDIVADVWVGSESLYEVFGTDAEHQRTFSDWLNIVHPADRERMARYFTDEVVGKRLPFDMKYRIVRPSDGVERWVHGLGKVQFSEDGRPLTLFGVIQDVSERAHVEDELSHERSLLLLAESIGHVGSWRLDLDTGAHRWSSEAATILGFDPSGGHLDITTALATVVHPEDAAVTVTRLQAILAARDEVEFDFRIVRQDGSERWVCIQGQAEIDAAGETVAIAGVLQDITARKLAEEARVGDLERVANLDRLTGLHNRRGFDLLAEQAAAQALRGKRPIGIMYCDIDGLKAINDEFGHPQGDRALRDFSSIMRFTLRAADAVARIGGDEFVVMTVGENRDALAGLVHRLQEGLEFFNATNERPYRLSASCGTAWLGAGLPCDLPELMVTADAQMYAEKQRRIDAAARAESERTP